MYHWSFTSYSKELAQIGGFVRLSYGIVNSLPIIPFAFRVDLTSDSPLLKLLSWTHL